jgi:hypothetical protein
MTAYQFLPFECVLYLKIPPKNIEKECIRGSVHFLYSGENCPKQY